MAKSWNKQFGTMSRSVPVASWNRSRFSTPTVLVTMICLAVDAFSVPNCLKQAASEAEHHDALHL